MNIKRVIATAALAVVPLTVSSAALAAPTSQSAAVALPAQVSAEGVQHASTVLTKVNELRSRLGLQPVTQYQELDAVAQDWSEQQAGANTMEHRPDFASSYPAGWTTGSENVAFRDNGGDIGALIFDQWLNSPSHYENMVNPAVNSIGIGFAQTSSGRWYATQNFAAYNPSNTPLTPTVTGSTSLSASSTPPTEVSVSAPAPNPSNTPTTPTAESTPPAKEVPPATETVTSEATATSSAPATVVTTTGTGTPTGPSSSPDVAAASTTPTRPSLATTGPSIAVAAVAAGLLGTGAVIVMRRRHAS